jgi:YVTN family beta-propeller protein
MSFRFVLPLLLLGASVALGQDKPKYVGPTDTGFLLPSGWHITPVGKHLVTADLPLNIVPLADNKHVLVANNGFNQHALSLVNISGVEPKLLQQEVSRNSWYGLAMTKSADKIWWSGGGSGMLHTFDFKDLKLSRTSPGDESLLKMGAAELAKLLEAEPSSKTFKSGLALNEGKNLLYSLNINDGKITAISLKDAKAEPKTEVIGGRPLDVVLGNLLYVSDWAGRQVLVLDPETLKIQKKIPVGEHPNQMALHPKDGRLFVACASSNSVSVIDTKMGYVTETIYTSLFPKAPAGSTPDALCVSPDGQTLYVANADNNCIVVIDIETPSRSQVKGFIPTGWYPTAVSITPDGKNLLIGVGKGLQSKANPFFTEEQLKAKEKDEVKAIARRIMPYPYIGTTMSGALTVLPIPDETKLKEYTAMVYRNCPYSDEQLTTSPHKEPTPIPTKIGDPSPIKYVVYVIKENRTYDQVFGDLAEGPNPKGKGDPKLCMFPRKVTPNHHKLAEEFVLLDNLYCNGQVSRDGHPWSTMAYHTDYTARDWHLTYSRRKGVDDDEEGNLQNSPSGHIWDACKRAGISYRNYGEAGKRVSDGKGLDRMEGRTPSLIGHMAPKFGLPMKKGQPVRDGDRLEAFLEEFREYEKNGNLPRFICMSLPEDHTTGTTPGTFTPQACVASGDLAVGKLVEALSKSRYWKEMAIFMIEDDAQNGPDSVDAHRTTGLVISPYTKRKFVDSNQYATVSMIRTMELILGLPPLSQYDAAARPMFNSFTNKADLTPYEHVPAHIDITAKNTLLSYGADRSSKMDWSEVDRINDFELNEILWVSIMGKDAPQPPTVRRAIAFRSLNAPQVKPIIPAVNK